MRISEAARELGVSVSTLRMWELKGLIANYKTTTGPRYYTKEDIKDIRVAMNMTRKIAKPKHTPAKPEPHNGKLVQVSRDIDWQQVRQLRAVDLIGWRRNGPGKDLELRQIPDDLFRKCLHIDYGLDDFVRTDNPGDADIPYPPILMPDEMVALSEQRKSEAQGLA